MSCNRGRLHPECQWRLSWPDVEKPQHVTGLTLRRAETSAPRMASDSISMFSRGLSPTTASTKLMLRFDSSGQGSHLCSFLLNSRTVSCRTVISLAMADLYLAGLAEPGFGTDVPDVGVSLFRGTHQTTVLLFASP